MGIGRYIQSERKLIFFKPRIGSGGYRRQINVRMKKAGKVDMGKV